MQHTWVSMYCSHPLCSIDLPVISKAVLHISHFLQQLLNCIHWNGNAIVVSINSAAIVIYKIRLEQSTPQYVFLCIINSSLHLAKACFWVAILICFNRCLKNTKWSLTNKLKKNNHNKSVLHEVQFWMKEKRSFIFIFFQAVCGTQESEVSSHCTDAKFRLLDVCDVVVLVHAWYPLY